MVVWISQSRKEELVREVFSPSPLLQALLHKVAPVLKSGKIKKGAGLFGSKSFKSFSAYHCNSKTALRRFWSDNIFYSNEFLSQFRDVLRDGVPDNVQVDAGIAMDDAVSHTV